MALAGSTSGLVTCGRSRSSRARANLNAASHRAPTLAAQFEAERWSASIGMRESDNQDASIAAPAMGRGSVVIAAGRAMQVLSLFADRL